MKNFYQRALSDYFLIILGSTIIGVAVQKFLAPVQLVVGGLTGISIILENLFSIPISISTLLLNIPLFIIWAYQRGIHSVARTIITVCYLTFAYWYCTFCPDLLPKSDNLLLATIYGGLGLGVGMGLILRANSSSGGTDMAANLLHYKFTQIPISTFMFSMDAMIIVSGAILFGVGKALYAILSAFIISQLVYFILAGGRSAKAMWVISRKIDIIAPKLQEMYNRNGAIVDALELSSSKDRKMMYIVVPKKQIFKAQEIISQIDKDAFITVTDVREVWGILS